MASGVQASFSNTSTPAVPADSSAIARRRARRSANATVVVAVDQVRATEAGHGG
jgi:hypothetical protein